MSFTFRASNLNILGPDKICLVGEAIKGCSISVLYLMLLYIYLDTFFLKHVLIHPKFRFRLTLLHDSPLTRITVSSAQQTHSMHSARWRRELGPEPYPVGHPSPLHTPYLKYHKCLLFGIFLLGMAQIRYKQVLWNPQARVCEVKSDDPRYRRPQLGPWKFQ